MKSPTVRVMAAADEDPAVGTIVLAFAEDPMARWTWPHAHQYL
ncbi:MAG: GNAT family N-acetyltransferase, partial [Mesorhizobium sp.]